MVISGIDAKIKAWTPPTSYKFQDNIISSDHATTKVFIPSYEKYVCIRIVSSKLSYNVFLRKDTIPKAHAYLCITYLYLRWARTKCDTTRERLCKFISMISISKPRPKEIYNSTRYGFVERDARASSYYCRTSISEFGGEKRKFGKRQSFQRRVRINYCHEW